MRPWKTHRAHKPGNWTRLLVCHPNGRIYRLESCEYGCCVQDKHCDVLDPPYEWAVAESQDGVLDALPEIA